MKLDHTKIVTECAAAGPIKVRWRIYIFIYSQLFTDSLAAFLVERDAVGDYVISAFISELFAIFSRLDLLESLLAGVVKPGGEYLSPLISDGMFVDLNKMSGLHLDEPYWDQQIRDAASGTPGFSRRISPKLFRNSRSACGELWESKKGSAV